VGLVNQGGINHNHYM